MGKPFPVLAQSFRTSLFRFGLAICLSLAALAPRSAAADDTAAVDAAIQFFLISGQAAGLPITPDEVTIVKTIVTCALNNPSVSDCVRDAAVATLLKQIGGQDPALTTAVTCLAGGQKPADCVSQTVVGNLPAEAQPFANCVLGGGNIADCGAKLALAQLPPDAQQMVTCLTTKTPAQCAAQLAGQNLSPEAQALITCFANGGTPQTCLLDPAQRQAMQAALDTIKKLKAEADATLNPAPGKPATLANIIRVAQGFKDGNWSEIAMGLGPELAKLTCKIVLDAVLTPALQPVIGPIVDAMIDNDASALFGLIKALENGDGVGVAKIALEWYAVTYFETPCALLPEGDFKEAVCGNLAKAVVAIGEAAGDAAKTLLGLGEDFLKATGIYQLGDEIAGAFASVWDDTIGSWFGGPPKRKLATDCGTPAAYYAGHYLTCLSTAVDYSANGSSAGAALGKACNDWFNRCSYDAIAVAKTCSALGSSLDGLAQRTAALFTAPADAYGKTAAAYAQEKADGGFDMCDPKFWDTFRSDFINGCVGTMSRLIPLRDPGNACPVPSLSYTAGARARACEAGLSKMNLDALAGPKSDLCKWQEYDQYQEYLKCKLPDALAGAFVNNLFSVKEQTVQIPGGSVTLRVPPKTCRKVPDPHLMDVGGKLVPIPMMWWPLPPASEFGLFTQGVHPPKVQVAPFIMPTVLTGPPKLVTLAPNGTTLIRPSGSGGFSMANLDAGAQTKPQPASSDSSGGKIKPDIGLVPLPRVSILPRNSGGSRGGSNAVVDPQDGSARTTLPNVRNPGVGRAATGGGGGQGGFNTVKGETGHSAMDVLGNMNTDRSLGGAAGNAGGISDQRPRPGSAPASTGGGGSGGFSTVKGQSGANTGGGTGGFNTVKSQSGANTGGGTGGFNTVKGDSGNAPIRPVPRIRIDRTAPSSGPVDYGGCPGCGRDTFRAPR